MTIAKWYGVVLIEAVYSVLFELVTTNVCNDYTISRN